MKTLSIVTASALSLLITTAEATDFWPSPKTEANALSAAKSMANAGASAESIANNLLSNHFKGTQTQAFDLANKLVNQQKQGQSQGQNALSGGNTLQGGDTTVEATEIPKVTAGFHFQAPNLNNHAPVVFPGAHEVALGRGVSTLLGAIQWDELETTHAGNIAALTAAFGDDPKLLQAYTCDEEKGLDLGDIARTAGYSCPDDTIGDLR